MSALPPGRADLAGRSDRPVWLVLAIIAVILVVLSVTSAANYTSVVLAKSTVYVVPRYTVTWSGTNPDGSLTDIGSVNVSLSLTVENPSPRTLRIRLVGYSGWVEDGPAQAGLNLTRRATDDRLIDADGTHFFFRVFGDSTEVSTGPIASRGNATFVFVYSLVRTANPPRFDALRNITEYAASTGTPIVWNHWVRVQMPIEGVPPATSPTAAQSLLTIDYVEREVGENLAT